MNIQDVSVEQLELSLEAKVNDCKVIKQELRRRRAAGRSKARARAILDELARAYYSGVLERSSTNGLVS